MSGGIPGGRPPGASTVDDQPGEHERDRGTDMPHGQEQDEDPDPELGREHDGDGQQGPRPGPWPGYAPGQQGGDEHDERVGHRRGDVRGVGVQADQAFQQRVLRQFGRVERDVRQVPAVQQDVAVQHVRGHEQDVRLVGILRVGTGHHEVRDEEQDSGQREGRPREQAAGLAGWAAGLAGWTAARFPGRPGVARGGPVGVRRAAGRRGGSLRRTASAHHARYSPFPMTFTG